MKLCTFAASCLFISFALATAQAGAQDKFPSKPIQILTPQAPGTAVDVLARLYAEKLAPRLGTSLVVQNRPGAGGTIAAQAVAKATPDGYTLMLVNTQHSMNPALYANPGYDTLRDFSGVAMIADAPALVYVNPALGVRSLKDLLTLARQKPSSINYGSGGIGSATHLAGAYFASRANIDMVHVPYKTGSDLIADLLSGRIQTTLSPVAFLLSQVREGKLLALAVTSRQRVAALPDVPTVDEAGVAGYEFTTWYGFVAPSKTPRATLELLSRALQQATNEKEVQERYMGQGMISKFLALEEFDAFLKTDVEKIGVLVKAIGAKAD
ncbi:MAG: tripartite tricarboxylate transporter substrate binding protein [Burkholderiales bacterium]